MWVFDNLLLDFVHFSHLTFYVYNGTGVCLLSGHLSLYILAKYSACATFEDASVSMYHAFQECWFSRKPGNPQLDKFQVNLRQLTRRIWEWDGREMNVAPQLQIRACRRQENSHLAAKLTLPTNPLITLFLHSLVRLASLLLPLTYSSDPFPVPTRRLAHSEPNSHPSECLTPPASKPLKVHPWLCLLVSQHPLICLDVQSGAIGDSWHSPKPIS